MLHPGQIIGVRHVLKAVECDMEFVERQQRVEVVVGEVLTSKPRSTDGLGVR